MLPSHGASVKTERHVLEALRAYASTSWHGKGCAKLICGSVCLCGPCHARVALEKMEADAHVSRAEQAMTTRALIPKGRWRMLTKVSPSGKTLFVCLSCGTMSPTTPDRCSGGVTDYTGMMRDCSDWKPSPFEVQ